MNTGWRYVLKQCLLVLLVAVLCVLFLAIGLMLGYSVFGDGKNPFSILSTDKWVSIINKFTGK